MPKFEGMSKEVLDKTEWVAIVTWDGQGPHLSATWGDYIRSIGVPDNGPIAIPAGRMRQTEENLNKNGRVELLIASKSVDRPNGSGQGCRITGRGELQTSGELFDKVKEKFSWARAALVVHVEEVTNLLG